MRPVTVGQLLLLPLLLLAAAQVENADAVRGSSYRRSRSSRNSFSSRWHSRLSDKAKVTALTNGMFLTSYRWRIRHSYYANVDDVKICFNIVDAVATEYNSSVQVPWLYRNRSVYGVFACPLGDRDDQVYCCGDRVQERCCSYWEDTGRVIGVVAGIVVGLAVLGYVAHKLWKKCDCDFSFDFSCCRRQRRQPQRVVEAPPVSMTNSIPSLSSSLHRTPPIRRESLTSISRIPDSGAPPSYEEAQQYPVSTDAPPAYPGPLQPGSDSRNDAK